MFLDEFFYMPKSDRRAILALCTLGLIVAILFGAVTLTGDESNPIDKEASVDGNPTNRHGKQANPLYEQGSYDDSNVRRNIKLTYFDPNTADSTQLLSLGLQPWQVRNIYKYRQRGGVYRCKEDFAYVYGLTVKDYRRLAPYIRIAEDYRPAYTLAEVRNNKDFSRQARESKHADIATNEEGERKPYTPKIHLGQYVEVNNADTTELMKIPGIGSYYSRQIMRYRNMLGGFAYKEQLLEIENFPEEAMKYIAINTEKIQKLRINQLSISQMKRHPYINYYQARAIADYRRLRGKITSMSELKLMKEFSPSDIKRIEPYVEY